MILKSISIIKKRKEEIIFDLPESDLDTINLFIGDNAMGKTRILNTLGFVKSIFLNRVGVVGTNFRVTFKFGEESNSSSIAYSIVVKPKMGRNQYSEVITKDGELILDSSKRRVLNENSKKYLDNYFIPSNILTAAAISGPEYPTISAIQEFFARIVFVDSIQSRTQNHDTRAIVLDPRGRNLPGVLRNYEKNFPHIYEEIIDEFKSCFRFLKNIRFNPLTLKNPDIKPDIKTEILSFSEKGIAKDIPIMKWSSGMYRLLQLITIVKTPFRKHGKKDIMPPSLVCIDEIENGLDYKTLKFIAQYLEDHSHNIQIIASSHSPLMCDFIHPKYWRIVKRDGAKINLKAPIEEDLEDNLDFFRQDRWDFYVKHIANSKLYSVK